MTTCLSLRLPNLSFLLNPNPNFLHHYHKSKIFNNNNNVKAIKASIETDPPPFKLFQPPPQPESWSSEIPIFTKSDMYEVRAYGVEFKEGPNVFGVYASEWNSE